MSDQESTTDDERVRQCPFCKEEIKSEAIKCKHCGSRVTPEAPAHGGICPYCKEEINPEAIKCKHCKSTLNSDKNADCGCTDGQGRASDFGNVGVFRPGMVGLSDGTPDRVIFRMGTGPESGFLRFGDGTGFRNATASLGVKLITICGFKGCVDMPWGTMCGEYCIEKTVFV
jgi:hypothetical protein